MPHAETSVHTDSSRRKPHCSSSSATTVSTSAPAALSTRYPHERWSSHPNWAAANAARIARAPTIWTSCIRPPSTRVGHDLGDPPPEIGMVELEREAEAPRRLLLQALPEVDARPQAVRGVADAVARVRELEMDERSRIGPALEEAALVPGVDGRVDRPCVPAEQRHEPPLQVAVEAGDGRVHLTAPELPRDPERVVPEVVRELGERNLGRRLRGRRGLDQPGDRVLEPDPVDENAVPTRQDLPGVRHRRQTLDRRRRQDNEVDVLAGLVQDATLAAAVEGRLEERENGRPELLEPVPVVEVARGLLDDEPEIEIGPAVGRRLGARLRA